MDRAYRTCTCMQVCNILELLSNIPQSVLPKRVFCSCGMVTYDTVYSLGFVCEYMYQEAIYVTRAMIYLSIHAFFADEHLIPKSSR